MTPAILFKILIGAAAVFALFQLRRVKEKYSRWITIAMVATAIVSILPAGPLSYDGHIAHAVVTFIALVYVFAPRADEPDTTQKTFSAVILGIPLVTMFIELAMVANLLIPAYFACAVSVGCLVYIVAKDAKRYQNDIGILAVAGAGALARLGLAFIMVS